MIQLNVTIDDAGAVDVKSYITGNVNIRDFGKLLQAVNVRMSEVMVTFASQATLQSVQIEEVVRGLRLGQLEVISAEYNKVKPIEIVKEEVAA